ncbi:MAG: RecX family transcriptional regulator [Myxococcota bacterium]
MPKAPRRISAPYLARVTAHYLERYATSKAHLRRLLLRRVHRSARHHEADPEPWIELVDEELDRLERLGFLNDDAYAADRARALHRRGAGVRKIQMALREKGLASEVIEDAIAQLGEGGEDPDWVAACTFARKRRLGPWRREDADDDRRRKELGRLARAGFSFDVARRIVDAESEEALLEADRERD